MSKDMSRIVVVVPFFNEEKLLGSLAEAFKAQTDQMFHVVYVDNGTTDSSAAVIHKAQEGSRYTYEIIEESEKGTGCASDTGFRYAITVLNATYIARTDADCLPDPYWIASIRRNLIDAGLDFVAGIIKPRTDDIPVSRLERFIISLMIFGSDLYGKFYNGIVGYRYIFFMVAGNNLAITADMYLASGGFPRVSIDTTDEDLVLAQRIRKITTKARKCRDMVVYNSVRRLRAYGHWNVLMWYKQRTYRPAVIDIR